jgi:hypothetical protein
MTMSEAAEAQPEKPFLPRWAVYALLPGFIGPLLILVFIFVNELAHDEKRCPYVPGQTRTLSETVAVREDHRNCLWGIEEHRFSVLRGAEERSLGRRRFRADAFAPSEYHWEAQLSPQNEVSLTVHNPGHRDAAFREGTEAERAQ